MKKADKSFWNEYEISEQKVFYWSIGEINIWCIFENNELKIAYQYTHPNEKKIKSTIPENVTWNRWIVSEKKMKLNFKPVMPDRPVVVEAENYFKLTKGASTRIYVRIPVWIKIEAINKKKNLLLEIPSVILSHSWFGSFYEGELCYWISSSARAHFKLSPARPFLAITPIQLFNKSDEELSIEKICLQVQNLSLFYKDQQLWTDEMILSYKGSNHVSEIKVGGKAPAEATDAALLGPSRQPIKKAMSLNTFSSLKELAGLGHFINE
jgi:hypothetical protein